MSLDTESATTRVIKLLADGRSRFATEISKETSISITALGYILPALSAAKILIRIMSTNPVGRGPATIYRYKIYES